MKKVPVLIGLVLASAGGYYVYREEFEEKSQPVPAIVNSAASIDPKIKAPGAGSVAAVAREMSWSTSGQGKVNPTPQNRITPTAENLSALFSPRGAGTAQETPSAAGVLHSKFESEPSDPNWSSGVESNALQFFGSQPSSSMVDVSMQCHATICELLMVSNASDGSGLAEQQWEQWQQTIGMSWRQDWWQSTGLVDSYTQMSASPDGQIIAATYFTKSPIVTQPPIRY